MCLVRSQVWFVYDRQHLNRQQLNRPTLNDSNTVHLMLMMLRLPRDPVSLAMLLEHLAYLVDHKLLQFVVQLWRHTQTHKFKWKSIESQQYTQQKRNNGGKRREREREKTSNIIIYKWCEWILNQFLLFTIRMLRISLFSFSVSVSTMRSTIENQLEFDKNEKKGMKNPNTKNRYNIKTQTNRKVSIFFSFVFPWFCFLIDDFHTRYACNTWKYVRYENSFEISTTTKNKNQMDEH